jgi:hypothetical protein
MVISRSPFRTRGFLVRQVFDPSITSAEETLTG